MDVSTQVRCVSLVNQFLDTTEQLPSPQQDGREQFSWARLIPRIHIFCTSSTRTRRAEVALKIYIYKTFLIYRTCMRRAPAKPVRACTLRNWCLVSHVTFEAHFALHASHSTLHTPHFTLHPSLSTLHTSQSTLHTSHSALHTSHSTLHTALFLPHTSHCTLHLI